MGDDDERDEERTGPPLPPEDRLWRHPSEMAATGAPREVVLVERAGPSGRRLVLVSIVSLLLGAGTATGFLLGSGALVRETPGPTSREVRDVSPGSPGDNELAIAESVLDAVARVEASGPKGSFNATAVGFRSDGQLITTADAVDGASRITVVLRDGRRLTTPQVTLVGQSRDADVAVLKIPVDDLPIAAGSKRRPRFGEQTVVVDGSPVTRGASIGVGVVTREIAQVTRQHLAPVYGLVEATTRAMVAPLGPGSLFLDDTGAVIGLVTGRGEEQAPAGTATSKAAATSGRPPATSPTTDKALHYAVPADHAWDVAAQIADTRQVVKPWVGLSRGEDITVDEANRTQIQGGMRVTHVEDASPAQAAGVRVGDIVVAIGGDNVRSYNEFVAVLRRQAPGADVVFTVIHKGEYVPTYVTIGRRVEK